MKKIVSYLFLLIVLSSCNEDVPLTFSEINYTSEEHAIVEVNIPFFEGSSEASTEMNKAIENFVISSIISKVTSSSSINGASDMFDAEFIEFSESLAESPQPWEAFVEGEVTYQSSELVCVALNAYKNTGGAHGNSVISFLNFNPSTGDLYSYNDIIDQLDQLKVLVEKHFKIAIEEESEGTEEVISNNFKLPETIGFSDDGVIIVYNQHELDGFSQKLLEFTIPFEEVIEFLTVR